MAKKSVTFKGKVKPFGKSGHFHESRRHSLQARGFKTGNMSNASIEELKLRLKIMEQENIKLKAKKKKAERVTIVDMPRSREGELKPPFIYYVQRFEKSFLGKFWSNQYLDGTSKAEAIADMKKLIRRKEYKSDELRIVRWEQRD